jgi:hypothetical protein
VSAGASGVVAMPSANRVSILAASMLTSGLTVVKYWRVVGWQGLFSKNLLAKMQLTSRLQLAAVPQWKLRGGCARLRWRVLVGLGAIFSCLATNLAPVELIVRVDGVHRLVGLRLPTQRMFQTLGAQDFAIASSAR